MWLATGENYEALTTTALAVDYQVAGIEKNLTTGHSQSIVANGQLLTVQASIYAPDPSTSFFPKSVTLFNTNPITQKIRWYLNGGTARQALRIRLPHNWSAHWSPEHMWLIYTNFGTLAATGNVVAQVKSLTIENPGASEDVSFFFTNTDIKLSQITAVVRGTSSPEADYTVRYGTLRTDAGTEVITGGSSANSTGAGVRDTVFTNDTIPSNSFVWIETTATVGTVNELAITMQYTED